MSHVFFGAFLGFVFLANSPLIKLQIKLFQPNFSVKGSRILAPANGLKKFRFVDAKKVRDMIKGNCKIFTWNTHTVQIQIIEFFFTK